MDIVAPLLNNDVMDIFPWYIRQMYSNGEMIKIFGDEHGYHFLKKMAAEFNDKRLKIANSGKSPAKIMRDTVALQKDMEASIQALETSINHAKGFRGVDWSEVGEWTATQRVVGTISNLNVARFLSDSVFAQLQDQANVALRLDGASTLAHSLVNFMRLAQPQFRRELGQLIRDYGVGAELYMGGLREKTLVSVARKADLLGLFERTSEWAARTAIRISGTPLLDAFTQTNTAYMTQNMLKRMAKKARTGARLSENELRFANNYALSQDDFLLLDEQFEKYGTTQNNVTAVNVSKWDNKRAQQLLQKIVYDNASKATMVPGAELPPIFRSPLGKLFLQFKSFTTATFNRMFIPTLERGNNAISSTVAQCLILDTFGKWCKMLGKTAPAQRSHPITAEKHHLDTAEAMMLAFQESIRTMDWGAWAIDP
jgi:hypothetical protein